MDLVTCIGLQDRIHMECHSDPSMGRNLRCTGMGCECTFPAVAYRERECI